MKNIPPEKAALVMVLLLLSTYAFIAGIAFFGVHCVIDQLPWHILPQLC